MFSLKKYQVLSIITSLIISLLLTEVILRVINFPYQNCSSVQNLSETRIGKFDPLLGWDYIPYKSTTGEYGVTYTFNSEGYRTNDINYKTDLSKPIILIVGDSILFGHGVNFEDTFGYKLQKKLKDKYEIINFAVQGYGTDQAYLKLTRVLPIYRPKIIVTDFMDDHFLRNVNIDRRDYNRCFRVIGTKPVFSLEGNKLKLVHQAEPYSVYDNPRILLLLHQFLSKESQDIKMQRGLKLTKRLLEEMKNYAQNNQADFYQINVDSSNIEGNNQTVLGVSINYKDTKYIINSVDTHPNPLGTSYMVDQFLEKFPHLYD